MPLKVEIKQVLVGTEQKLLGWWFSEWRAFGWEEVIPSDEQLLVQQTRPAASRAQGTEYPRCRVALTQ